MSVTVKIEGLRDLEQALGEVSQAAGRGAMRRALIKAGGPLVDKAKALAPVDSGALRASFAISAKLGTRQARLQRGLGLSKSEVRVYVGPSYDLGDGGRHAHLVEFGTRHHGPQPFMRPAWSQDKRAVLQRLQEAVWAELQKSIARAERKAARAAARSAIS